MFKIDELENKYVDISSCIMALEQAQDYAKSAKVELNVDDEIRSLKKELAETDDELTKLYLEEEKAMNRAFQKEVLG